MTITKEGALASFYTVNKAPIKHLRVYFSPKQAGTGDPSPENVREISGWNGLEVYDIGKNLIDKSQARANSVWWNGTRQYWPNANVTTIPLISVKPGLQFYKEYMTTSQGWVSYFDRNKVFLQQINIASKGIYTVPSNAYYIGFSIDKDKLDTAYVSFNINNTKYEPYHGNTYTLDWSNDIGTIYGGYVDLVTGELVQTYGSKIYNGTETWSIEQSASFYTPSGRAVSETATYVICSHFPSVVFSASGTDNNAFIWTSGNLNIQTTSVEHTGSAMKNYCLEQYNNGTPLTVIYPLVTPITHQLTPTQLQTLIGRNNIWSNADRVEVEYDLAESNDELYRRRNILLRTPHLVTPAPAPLQSFNTDMVAPLKECKVHFKPIQEGSGDPSHENVREIGGWNGIKWYQSNKIIADCEFGTINGNTAEELESSKTLRTKGYFILYPNNTYNFKVISNRSTAQLSRLYLYNTSNEILTYTSSISASSHNMYIGAVNGTQPIKARFTIKNSDSSNNFITSDMFNTIIEVNNTEYIYSPSIGPTEIDWFSTAGTLYGGYVDLVSGEVWKTWNTVDLGTLIWTKRNSNVFYSGVISDKGAGNQLLYCSHYLYNYVYLIDQTVDKTINDTSQTRLKCVNIYDSDYANATTSEFRDAMSGVICAYKTSEPTLITTLTPTQLKTLRDTNNIWSNANGPIEVKYWTH